MAMREPFSTPMESAIGTHFTVIGHALCNNKAGTFDCVLQLFGCQCRIIPKFGNTMGIGQKHVADGIDSCGMGILPCRVIDNRPAADDHGDMGPLVLQEPDQVGIKDDLSTVVAEEDHPVGKGQYLIRIVNGQTLFKFISEMQSKVVGHRVFPGPVVKGISDDRGEAEVAKPHIAGDQVFTGVARICIVFCFQCVIRINRPCLLIRKPVNPA
jgi:hypothetical protein